MVRSYRWRRRFAWAGAFVVLVAVAVVAAVLLPKDTGRRYQLAPTGTTPAQTVAVVVKHLRVTAAMRRAINRTLVAFVRTGVTRADPAAAWPLATHAMHAAGTHESWNAGKLPVVPFPARVSTNPSWNVLSSYPGDVTIDLVLQPRSGSTRGPIAFAVEVKKQSKHGRWLVDSMVPEQVFAPSQPPAQKGSAQKGSQEEVRLSHGASHWWFVVPGGLLALAALVPVLLLMINWWRHRAIERRYRAERGL